LICCNVLSAVARNDDCLEPEELSLQASELVDCMLRLKHERVSGCVENKECNISERGKIHVPKLSTFIAWL
jgi:hypothetical protein